MRSRELNPQVFVGDRDFDSEVGRIEKPGDGHAAFSLALTVARLANPREIVNKELG